MRCPKCGFDQDEQAVTCGLCGLIFARWAERHPRALEAALPQPPGRKVLDADEPHPGRLPVAGRKALVIGVPAGIVAFALPLVGFVLGYLSILVHELGHALAGWSFGYPAIPAFDFVYGGGVTILDARNTGLLVVIYAAFVWLLWAYRRNTGTLWLLLGVVALHVAIVAGDAHEPLHLAAGHASELVFAGVFLFRALGGAGCFNEAERPLYAAVGTVMLLKTGQFALRLVTSAEFRAEYVDAKGGGGWMDLSLLADRFAAGDVVPVARVLLVLVLLTPVATWLLFRWQEPLLRALGRRLAR